MFLDRSSFRSCPDRSNRSILDVNNTSIYEVQVFIQKSTSWPNQKSTERAPVPKHSERSEVGSRKTLGGIWAIKPTLYTKKSENSTFCSPRAERWQNNRSGSTPKIGHMLLIFSSWVRDINAYHCPPQPGPQLSSTGTEMCSNPSTISIRGIGTILQQVWYRAKITIATVRGA